MNERRAPHFKIEQQFDNSPHFLGMAMLAAIALASVGPDSSSLHLPKLTSDLSTWQKRLQYGLVAGWQQAAPNKSRRADFGAPLFIFRFFFRGRQWQKVLWQWRVCMNQAEQICAQFKLASFQARIARIGAHSATGLGLVGVSYFCFRPGAQEPQKPPLFDALVLPSCQIKRAPPCATPRTPTTVGLGIKRAISVFAYIFVLPKNATVCTWIPEPLPEPLPTL